MGGGQLVVDAGRLADNRGRSVTFAACSIWRFYWEVDLRVSAWMCGVAVWLGCGTRMHACPVFSTVGGGGFAWQREGFWSGAPDCVSRGRRRGACDLRCRACGFARLAREVAHAR